MNNNDIEKESSEAVNPSGTIEHEESFAVLLEKIGGLPARLTPGEKVKAHVIGISGDLVYIDLTGKTEGVIDLNEFKDQDGNPKIHIGDEIEAFFVSVQDGIRKLTTFIHGYPASKITAIRDAYNSAVPVDGEIKREVKGGFEVSVGGVRCFCPFSQIDFKGEREGNTYVGQTLPFMVIEFKDEGCSIIISRRVLLEQERQARIEKLQKTLDVGRKVAGIISSIRKFGAFVDLGGIEGLIPTSEISWDRINNPGDLLSVGQEVTAKIVSLDWDNDRVTLSIKAIHPDPWSTVNEKYLVGSKINGTIVRLVPFGAFVKLEPGIDGLIHISNLGTGRRINHPKEVVEVGQLVEAYVLLVDGENRKISLSLQPKVEPKKIILPDVGELCEGVVEKIMPYGIFARMSSGLVGLIPNSEMGTSAGTDHKRMFPAGTHVQGIVIEVDKENNKVRLSRKAVMDREADAEYEEYRNSVKQSDTSGGFGSLGEILKAKLEEKGQTR